MREAPSEALIELVERLHLAGGSQVRGMHRRVKRLARELPLFESVWVDALAQARVLTPYQAAEINGGRGAALGIGPFVLSGRLARLGYADYYTARQIETGRLVRLAVARPRSGAGDGLSDALASLAAKCEHLDSERFAPIDEMGGNEQSLWVAGRHVEGRDAAAWMVHNGRFPPSAALEIARQMADALAKLEKTGFCHGDLAAWSLIITDSGRVILPHPGLRGILRPEEGYAQVDLLPEAYDYLAPERITHGTPPTVASDVYACGCLWWHLLTGRAPHPGGTALAKLRSVQTHDIPDVRALAPETLEPLARAVAACVEKEPDERPESMGRLASLLGPPTQAGKLHLTRCMTRPGEEPSRWAAQASAVRHSKQTPVWVAAVAGCLLSAAVLTWMVQETRARIPTASIRAKPAQPAAGPESEMSRPETTSAGDAPVEADTGSIAGSVLLLEAGPVRLDSLALEPGGRVSGRPDQRPVVLVPPQGLVVYQEGVRFENVDFLSVGDAHPTSGSPLSAGSERGAIIELRASAADFRGCSFQAAEGSPFPPVAIRWVHPVDGDQARLSLSSGRVRLSDCVIRGLGAGVVCRTAGAVAVEFTNTMHLGAGPLVVLDHAPGADEPVAVSLAAVTLRGASPVVECRYHTLEEHTGRIRIQAGQCAFAIGQGTGLLSFVGPVPPEPLLANVEWTGDGSLISPEAAVALWQQPDGGGLVLDDSAVSIAGLVRSAVEFAGPPEAGPAASRIVRWQAPLRSADPPGADPQALGWFQ